MTLPFQPWLNGLASAQKGPLYLPPATRQLAWSHNLRIDGDYSAAAFIGQVRAAPDAASALVAFTFGTPSFSAGVTTVLVSLAAGTGANSTGALPADADADGMEYFPYDILMTPSGGTQERLFGGLFTVSGHITLPA